MKHEPVKDHAERKRVLALIERCEKEQTMSWWSDRDFRPSTTKKVEKILDIIAEIAKAEYERGKEDEKRWWSGHCAKCTNEYRPQGEWIPCSERLPERLERVLVTRANGRVEETFKWNDEEYPWNGGYDDVLAWMPLPKPWKGADDAI